MRYGDRLREDAGFAAETTNNRMELQAAIEALAFLSSRRQEALSSSAWLYSPIHILTDSQYVKNGVTQWLRGWKARAWKTADRKPVKNQELWQVLDALVTELNPSFTWVEGHAGETDNERCDALVQIKIAESRKL